MAEKEGFEPSIRDKPYTPLAGERLQPLGHFSILSILRSNIDLYYRKSARIPLSAPEVKGNLIKKYQKIRGGAERL